MSTQRRANRTSPAIEIDRADVRRRWFRGCGERAGISIPEARTGSKLASVHQRPRSCRSSGWHGPGFALATILSQGTTIGWPQTLCYRITVSKRLPDLEASQVRRPVMGQAAAGCRFRRHAQVIPSAHSRPSRPHASPPHLAAGPSRRNPLGGKARWQKRFVFPARRMRRGLQF